MNKNTLSEIKKERAGLTMILASLCVIAVILGLLFAYQGDSKKAQIRSQGLSLVRMLAGMSPGQLVPPVGSKGMLQVLGQSQTIPEFAYATVVDHQGMTLSETVSPGVIVPISVPPQDPYSWLGERILLPNNSEKSILEFHAPLLNNGNLVGYVRLGYFEPGYGFSYDQLPFLATLALPIFLLTPAFYFLLRREVRPLRQVNEGIKNILDQGVIHKVDIRANGELGEFMQQLNGFIGFTQKRINELQNEQNGLVTSTKLLSYKRARVESVLQALPEAVIVLDESGEANYVNQRVSAVLGMSQDKIIGRKPKDWCKIPEVLEFLSRRENRGGRIAGYATETMDFAPSDNPNKRINVAVYPLFSPKDPEYTLGTLAVFRDTTEEWLAKNSRAEFVAQVAHELKTPLNVLAMYSESLLGEDGNSEEFRVEAVNIIHDEVERLSTLINNLLSITKFEMGGMQIEKQRVRLHDLLTDAFDNVAQSGRGKGLKFQLDLPKELSAIALDKDLMRIAVNNLLTNAIKYNRPGGTVILRAEETDGTIDISVRDTGLGIAEEDKESIFGKFFRSNDENVRAQTGHGLGLSLVKQIVHLHNGIVELHSTLGEGSEFTIRLDKQTGLLAQLA